MRIFRNIVIIIGFIVCAASLDLMRRVYLSGIEVPEEPDYNASLTSPTYAYVITGDGETRTSPGGAYKRDTTRGEIFELASYEKADGYFHIKDADGDAYVSADYVKVTDGLAAPTTESLDTKVLVRLNGNEDIDPYVRAIPGLTQEILGEPEEGVAYPLLDERRFLAWENGIRPIYYLMIDYHGRVGYVNLQSADFISYLPKQVDYSKYTEYFRIKRYEQPVYTQPDINSEPMATCYKADIFPLIATTPDGEFYETLYDEKKAFIPTQKTELVSPSKLTDDEKPWTAVISLRRQTVSVYEDGVLRRFMSCSSGVGGEEYYTPEGVFYVPYRKNYFTSHERSCFDAVKIIDSMGIYFHRIPRGADGYFEDFFTELLGTAASQGCIRLSEVHSRWMYENFPDGAKVVIAWNPESIQ